MASSELTKTVFFACKSTQGVAGFASMVLETCHLDPEVYNPAIVLDMLSFLTRSFGNLPFKLSINNEAELDLTSGPCEANPTVETKRAWQTFVLALLGTSEARVNVGIYSTACQVAAAMRKSTVEAAKTTWQMLAWSDLFHTACVKALASKMSASVFMFGLDYIEQNQVTSNVPESFSTLGPGAMVCTTTDVMTNFVFDALDELCPESLFTDLGVACVQNILSHRTGACFLFGLLNRVSASAWGHDDKDENRARAMKNILNEIAKTARPSLLSCPVLLPIILAVKPDFLCVDTDTESFPRLSTDYYSVALRSSFADKKFFEAFFSRLQSTHFSFAPATIRFLQAEAKHNIKLLEFMPAWYKHVLTHDFVCANIHRAFPIEFAPIWNVQRPEFDEALVRRAVWLSLDRFSKAPLCVQKDHDLALAALLGGHVKPELLGPCWGDQAFVTRNIYEVASLYVICAPVLTPSLVVSALNVIREELRASWPTHHGVGDDADLFLNMVRKACCVFPTDPNVAQACLFGLSSRNSDRSLQTFNARVAEIWSPAFNDANLEVVCCFARSVDLECAASTLFGGFHGQKHFASACVDNLVVNLTTTNKLDVGTLVMVDNSQLSKCFGRCCDDLDFALRTLRRLERRFFASFFPRLQFHKLVLALLDRLEK